jgi:N-acetylglucosaminyldiphosphoundecaprenol N-acetyl-beta-D-mannosaminyltransferase
MSGSQLCAFDRAERGAHPTFARKPPAIYIGGVRFDVVTRLQALETMAAFVQQGGAHLVCTPNLDHVVQCRADLAFRDTINRSSLAVADGMGVVYASRLLACPLPENVGGRLLCVEFCRLASRRGYRVCLVGGAPGIAEKAAEALCRNFPGLRVVGAFAPPMGFDVEGPESDGCVERIRRCSPHALFVAFGAPKQEMWLSRNRHRLGVPICMGVGYAFDLLAGKSPAPPSWMTRTGLEWAFRLWHDPGRLAKRYLWRDLRFFPILLSEVARRRGKPTPTFQSEKAQWGFEEGEEVAEEHSSSST